MTSNSSTIQFKTPQTSEEWIFLFIEACQSGDFDGVQRLCSSELKAIADIHVENEWAFRVACQHGYLDIVKFLTTSPKLLEAGHTFVDIHEWYDGAFRMACNNSHLEIVKFLTTSKELLEAGHTFADIHAFDDQAFQLACEYGRWNVIEFLIFDLKIEPTARINAMIKNYPQVKEFFNAREEQAYLTQSLMKSRSNFENQDQNHENHWASFRV